MRITRLVRIDNYIAYTIGGAIARLLQRVGEVYTVDEKDAEQVDGDEGVPIALQVGPRARQAYI